MAMRAPAAVLLLAVASVLAAGAAAQSTGTPACASKLTGCAGYMNGTDAQKPPETCCGPLRDAVKNEKPCLCALYASPEIFKAFNINVTDALRLSKRCGVSEDEEAKSRCEILDQMACNEEGKKRMLKASRVPRCLHLPHSRCGASPTKSPPGSSPSSPSGGGKSAGHRTMSAGFAGLMSLFLVLWSALA
ncbi:non-specific lipid transfer protein GPI-anchored 2-like [Triticum dicoccoides]|uniref:non-specific lipid transfer protein GPI-anchored 2-like n=1 Tax=Triticum dicoccoides TaxID=85692 RepID=UPI001891C8B0|nr:non-specific lipid transfer protein GPI-anchored 2-like [Triticum dicoccoides]